MTLEEGGVVRHSSRHRGKSSSRRHRGKREGSDGRTETRSVRSASRHRKRGDAKYNRDNYNNYNGYAGYTNYGYHRFGSADWTMQLEDPIMTRQIRKFSGAPPSASTMRQEFSRDNNNKNVFAGSSGASTSGWFSRWGRSGSRMSLYDFGDSFGAVYLGKVATDLLPDDLLQNRVAEALLRKDGDR